MTVRSEEIVKRFYYQRPSTPRVAELHELVSEKTCELAEWIDENIPDSRGKSIALTKLEEVRMWANQAVAMEQAEARRDGSSGT